MSNIDLFVICFENIRMLREEMNDTGVWSGDITIRSIQTNGQLAGII